MSSITLRMIELENYGRFYDTAKLILKDRITAVALGASCGKSTFASALEFLTEAVLEGNIKNSELNICRTFVDKPKNFVRIEILLEISDATHSGIYCYGISVTDIGVLSEYLLKENTGRRIFYRHKNDIDLSGLNDIALGHIKGSLAAQVPILHLLINSQNSISSYFIRFFQRLWIVRAGGLNYRLSAMHLFKQSFFTKRANVVKCCDFLRIFDPTVVDMIKIPSTSKVMVIHRNSHGYEYPVPLARESESFIKVLALYRAIEALSGYGGTVIWDAGDIKLTSINADRFISAISENVSVVFFSDNNRLAEHLDLIISEYLYLRT